MFAITLPLVYMQIIAFVPGTAALPFQCFPYHQENRTWRCSTVRIHVDQLSRQLHTHSRRSSLVDESPAGLFGGRI